MGASLHVHIYRSNKLPGVPNVSEIFSEYILAVNDDDSNVSKVLNV